MAHKFSDLVQDFSPEQKHQVETRFAELRQEMSLSELRNARELTQQNLATILSVGQPAIAKLEKRADMYLSTLRSYVQAMGGDVDIVARFPDGAVKISNLAAIGSNSLEPV